jgi:aspartate/methionine/tyrosine aminotransferase
MMSLEDKFNALGTEYAPGQEVRSAAIVKKSPLSIQDLEGEPVDFSHGDVDAFLPPPGALPTFLDGFNAGGKQAYTEYRGDSTIRENLAARLAAFTGAPVDSANGMILTPGTQGALFLAMAATISSMDRVAIVQPDYFANRKIAQFLGGEVVPVQMDYMNGGGEAGLDLDGLKAAFEAGAKVLVFSNPNNPTGVVYSKAEIDRIVELTERFGVTVIVDQLYSRLLYSGGTYTHLRASGDGDSRVVTIMGPSKTESLSGFRLGVAFGAPNIVERMEKLQAIVSLRAAGYNQAVLQTWFNEPAGWLDQRISAHQSIRDDLLAVLRDGGMQVRTPEAGSYLFPMLSRLAVSGHDFVTALRQHARVSVTPGTEFSPHAERSVRLNFSQRHSAAVDAVKRLVAVARVCAAK